MDDIKIDPDPPVAGGSLTVTLPESGGPWEVFIKDDVTGDLTSLGTITRSQDGSAEVTIPAGTGGDYLTITDFGDPVPTDLGATIVSTD